MRNKVAKRLSRIARLTKQKERAVKAWYLRLPRNIRNTDQLDAIIVKTIEAINGKREQNDTKG